MLRLKEITIKIIKTLWVFPQKKGEENFSFPISITLNHEEKLLWKPFKKAEQNNIYKYPISTEEIFHFCIAEIIIIKRWGNGRVIFISKLEYKKKAEK